MAAPTSVLITESHDVLVVATAQGIKLGNSMITWGWLEAAKHEAQAKNAEALRSFHDANAIHVAPASAGGDDQSITFTGGGAGAASVPASANASSPAGGSTAA